MEPRELAAMAEKWERWYETLVSPPPSPITPRAATDTEDEMDVATLELMLTKPLGRLSLDA
tara:strand:- start:1 stop:183 length:183 start_codon:yes stop_codon:yes gene_type:complete